MMDRPQRTLYITGFDPKRTTKRLLEELFTQGGPVQDVALFDTHAYIVFQDAVSVPYCLAIFQDIEVYGRKLRINPKRRSREQFSVLKYLSEVRQTLQEQYRKIKPPMLPPKLSTKQSTRSPTSAKTGAKKKKPLKKKMKKQKKTAKES